MSKCTRCEAHKNSYGTNCIPFSGNPTPQFYFLGEMTGNQEAKRSIIEPAHFIGDCYDEDTEVLTNSGWKFFQQLSKSDKFYSVNPESSEIEMVNSVRYIQKYYNGDMIHFKGRSVDLLVTPNHKMYCRGQNAKNFKFVESRKLIGRGRIKLTSIGTWCGGKDVEYDEYLLKFIGMWLGDGWKYKTKHGYKRIGFQFKKSRKIRYLDLIIKKLNVAKFYKFVCKNGNTVYEIYDDKLFNILPNYPKRIPEFVFDLSQHSQMFVLDGMMESDGNRKNNQIYNSEKNLIDDFQRLCFLCGIPSTISTPNKRKRIEINGRVIKSTKQPYVLCLNKRYKLFDIRGNKNINVIKYTGYIYDVTLEKNHTLVVRRNGRIQISSNSGKILDELLFLSGLKREEIAIANSLRCYKKDNSKPVKSELDACFIFTIREINNIDPEVVVALGGTAMYQALGIEDSVSNYRGKLLWSDKIKRKVFVTYHPMAVSYDPNKRKDIEEDFKRLKSLIDEEPYKIPNYEYTLIDTPTKFDYFYPSFLDKEMFIDMEMTGLDPFDKTSNIRTLQIEVDEHVYVILQDILFKRIDKIRYLFKSNPVIGQDFTIDAKWLHVRLDAFPENWLFDTCIAEYLLTGFGGNDLNTLVGKYNRDFYGYWKEVERIGGAHKVTDNKVLYQYGSNDTGTLRPIKNKQLKQLYKTNRNWLFENITMPCNKILTKMSLRGVKIDIETLKKTDYKYYIKGERALKKALAVPGIAECEDHFRDKFNPRSSNRMVKWLLLDYYKLPVLKETKKGNPSLSQNEMKIYAKKYDNPYCKIMEKYRSIQVIRENFLSGILPKINDEIAHTSYSLHATTTGRPNSKSPNLLNVPREKDIKRCYVARDGHTLVCGDEGQLEIRIASVVYDEPNLIEVCNDLSRDIHSNITAKAFDKTYEEVYNGYKNGDVYWIELRVKGKAVNFGILYQKEAFSLAYDLGISEKEAQAFIDGYFNNFPNLKENIEKLKRFVIRHGYADNYFGFRRSWKHHTENDKSTLREAVNFMIQSLAWNLIQLCMIQIDKELKKKKLKSELLLQVYDSIIVEALDEEVDEVAHIMQDVMTNVNKPYDNINRVLLATDIEIGKNLADLERYI